MARTKAGSLLFWSLSLTLLMSDQQLSSARDIAKDSSSNQLSHNTRDYIDITYSSREESNKGLGTFSKSNPQNIVLDSIGTNYQNSFNYANPNGSSNAECRDVRHQNDSAKCNFVQRTDDCSIDEGFIDYTISVFCTFGPKLTPLAVTLLVVWWLFLFIALAVAADQFFCPSLVVIARTLRMSDNIAGVTLLAFGNGAPDVFSAIAAAGNMKKGDAGLLVGALVGAGVFVTTVVAGSVAMVTPFHAMERPFLRDIIFYLLAVFMAFYVFYTKVITLVEAAAFIVIYVIYVIVVIVGRYIYQARKRQLQTLTTEEEENPEKDINDATDGLTRSPPPSANSQPSGEKISSEHDSDESDAPSELTPLLGSESVSVTEISAGRAFLMAICPIDIEGWQDETWYGKIYAVFKVPAEFILLLTVPIVDFSAKNDRWNRHLNSLQCITAPLTALFCANHKAALTELGGVFPVWALVLLIGTILAGVVYCTSQNNTPPVYHRVFAFIGFIAAVLWIAAIANEIVNLLQTFGIIFSISNAILGLTLLAWGNSLGDLVADTTMAKQGQPKIGISACFGGPMFNLLMGIGIPFTIKTISNGNVELDFTVIQVLLLAALATSLISSLVILPIIGFKLNRFYGFYLYALYVVFLILVIVIETGVIKDTL